VADVVCPHCHHNHPVPEESIGRLLRCPKCKASFPARAAAISTFDGLLFRPLGRAQPTVAISCPSCSHKREAPAEFVGQKVRCPKCRTHFLARPAAINGFDGLLFWPLERAQPMATISCPSCSYQREAPEEFVGQSVRCPKCRTQFLARPATRNSLGGRVPEAPDGQRSNANGRQGQAPRGMTADAAAPGARPGRR
jgi:hypothetical protein